VILPKPRELRGISHRALTEAMLPPKHDCKKRNRLALNNAWKNAVKERLTGKENTRTMHYQVFLSKYEKKTPNTTVMICKE